MPAFDLGPLIVNLLLIFFFFQYLNAKHLHAVVQKAEYHVPISVAVRRTYAETNGIWCMKMMIIATMMTQMMK